MQLDPRHLAQLAIIIEKRSFSKAAEALGTTQPALSKVVGDLEKRIGVKLLEQRRNPVLPTPLGSHLANQGYKIRAALDEAVESVSDTRSGDKGLVRIGAPPFFCDHTIPELILQFQAQHPNVSFELRAAYRSNLLEMIEARELDIALVPLIAEHSRRPFKTYPLLHMTHAVVCRAQHPMTRLQRVSADDLARAVWVSQTPNSMLHDVLMNALSGLRVENVEFSVLSESASALMKVLQNTDCLTVLPEFSVAGAIRSGQLAILPTEPLPAVSFGAIWHSTLRLPPAAEIFFNHLKAGFHNNAIDAAESF